MSSSGHLVAQLSIQRDYGEGIGIIISDLDKRFAACPGKENTVQVWHRATEGAPWKKWCTYYGHQLGVHHVVTPWVTNIFWKREGGRLLITSKNSSENCQTWEARTGIHFY